LEGSNSGNNAQHRQRTRTVTYTHTEDRMKGLGIPGYVKDGIYLVFEGNGVNKGGPNIRIGRGKRVYPFQFTIPSGFNLPSSYGWDGVGRINYTLHAYMDNPMWRDFGTSVGEI